MNCCTAACGWCGRCDDEDGRDDDQELTPRTCPGCGWRFVSQSDHAYCLKCRGRQRAEAAREVRCHVRLAETTR